MENDPGTQALRRRGSDESTLEASSRLLDAATREWRAVAESLYDLKKALEPEDFAAALAHMKIPGLEGLVRDWRKAQVDYRSALNSTTKRRAARAARAGTKPEAPPAARVEPPRETGESTAQEPRAARGKTPRRKRRENAAEPAPAGAGGDRVSADGTTGIQEQLAELTNLLRQHVALTSGQDSGSRIEIPKQLTLNIAREVAGRVKDSVLETLRQETDRKVDRTADEKPSRRVPLEDVAAMIDQLTKF